MMTRTTINEFKEAICEAVAELDQCDGSRIGQGEAIDSARNILQTVYGDDLDADVQDVIDSQDRDDDGDAEEEEDDDDPADDDGDAD